MYVNSSVVFHHQRVNMNSLKISFMCMCLYLLTGNQICCYGQKKGPSNIPTQESTFAPLVNTTKCRGNTICKEVFNYPEEYILQAIQGKATKFNHLFGRDKIDTNIANRFMDLDKTLCDSVVQLEEPKAGKNKDDEWIFIVNHGDYKQAVEVRLCTKESDPCRMDEVFPYRTECRQKYILRKMLAIDPKNGQLKEDTIKLPSCCSCRFFEKKIKS